jgi:hypothetical protein
VQRDNSIRFALNHMVATQLSVADFFGLTRLGLTEVEIRNDIAGKAILDGTKASDVIWVFRRGRIAGVVDRDKTTGNEIVSMITGVTETRGEASTFA